MDNITTIRRNHKRLASSKERPKINDRSLNRDSKTAMDCNYSFLQRTLDFCNYTNYQPNQFNNRTYKKK